MTDAQVYSSFCKAHKLLCAVDSIPSDDIASAIILSLVHSGLHHGILSDQREQDLRSLSEVASVCEIPLGIIRDTFDGIPAKTLSQVRKIIESWSINFDVYERVFGSLFEKYITKKESGAYYTAPITTEFITLRSLIVYLLQEIIETDTLYVTCSQSDLFRWFKDLIDNLDEDRRNIILKRLREVSIVDPTCGTGAFLIQAFKCILKVYRLFAVDIDARLVRDIILNNLYGVDIDPDAITILKFRFLVIAQSYGVSDLRHIPNFKAGNTVNSDSFNWRTEFANGGLFDIVVGNPPYLETNKHQRESYDNNLAELRKSVCFCNGKSYKAHSEREWRLRLYCPSLIGLHIKNGTVAQGNL